MAKYNKNAPSFYKRIETEIENYLSSEIELSERVSYSQYKVIRRIYQFKGKNLSGSKTNEDLSYNFHYDIITPRVDSEVKNLRLDTKHILLFSQNPTQDFPAVFISNAKLKAWMLENGEDEKLKDAVAEFSENGNVGFKRVGGGYETVDILNTYHTNQTAKTINDTDIIERHEMTASEIQAMSEWDNIDEVIEDLGDKSYQASERSTDIESSKKVYEVFEFTGEVSEKEYNELLELDEEGDENIYFLAKVICAGLTSNSTGEKYLLFCEKLTGKMEDHYIYAHRGRYDGRFWRIGLFELLFDYQIRANQIGNDLARGLEWAGKTIFHTTDNRILQNIRADLENGSVIIAKDIKQLQVRNQSIDQLIADWNRLMADADRLTNSLEIVRGEQLPSGTPFRLGALQDQNAGKLFILLRQKIAMSYRRVFREWVLPNLVKDLKGEDIFRLIGDTDILDQFREIVVNSWYMKNLVEIGPHTREMAETIKAEKLDELRKVDPVIKNSKEIWESVLPRMFVTITGENSDIQDQLQDLVNLIQYEQDPERRAWILDTVYKVRNIPIPPKPQVKEPAETQTPNQGAGTTPPEQTQETRAAVQPTATQ